LSFLALTTRACQCCGADPQQAVLRGRPRYVSEAGELVVAGSGTMATGGGLDDNKRTVMIVDMVRAIWCRELQCDGISVDDNFFALGGQSLIMAKIQMAFIEELGVEVPADQMFLNPTVASISGYIESLGAVTQ
jgi:acyl carrier protein